MPTLLIHRLFGDNAVVSKEISRKVGCALKRNDKGTSFFYARQDKDGKVYVTPLDGSFRYSMSGGVLLEKGQEYALVEGERVVIERANGDGFLPAYSVEIQKGKSELDEILSGAATPSNAPQATPTSQAPTSPPQKPAEKKP